MSAPLTARQAVLLVARRELVTQVRSRSFVIGLVITLVLFGGVFLITGYISSQASSKTLGVTAQAAQLRPALEESARAQDIELTIREIDAGTGRAQVADGELDALLTGEPGGYQLLGLDTVDSDLQAVVTSAIQQQTLTMALAGTGVDQAQLAARSQLAVDTLEPVDPDAGQKLAIALVGTFLLFFSVSTYGGLVASGVVEEKQSRIVELLLATIKPRHLLAGKIIGLGAAGLLQLVILSAIGTVGALAAGLLTVPGATVGMFAMVIVWYLLGFFLYAALYAAVGSTVSRQEELGTVLAPMILLLIIPLVPTLNLLPNDPRNELAAVMSFVPFFSQVVMPARYALGVASLGEVLISALIAVIAIVVVVRLAGRVYQNSVLRTGARVTLREALRT
ncbi:MAG: ABC transporter permease [Pseudonocardia sp.]